METVSINKLLELFNQLSRPEQLKVAEKISMHTFNDSWDKLDKELPDVELSEQDILTEIRDVRYGPEKKD